MQKLLDAKGQNCPIPVVMAKKEIDGGLTEFTIEVDNQTAVENLQRLADSYCYRTTTRSGGGIFSIIFTKSPEDQAAMEELQNAQAADAHDWALFVGRETLGEGDPQLGEALMKMYFYTLAQGDGLPKSVLFMNGGVKLPTLNDEVVGHLKTLAARGVELLVCGTCLNFFGITEKLQVGTVSNMYDIQEQMKAAAKVVSL